MESLLYITTMKYVNWHFNWWSGSASRLSSLIGGASKCAPRPDGKLVCSTKRLFRINLSSLIDDIVSEVRLAIFGGLGDAWMVTSQHRLSCVLFFEEKRGVTGFWRFKVKDR